MTQLNIDKQALDNEKQDLESFLARPDAYTAPDYQEKSRRLSEVSDILRLAAERDGLDQQLKETRELADGGGELAELAKDELPELEAKLSAAENQLSDLLTPKDENDPKDVIVEIRAGAGGDEASIFAGDLLRMYLRYCENVGLKTELLSESPSDNGGYKEVVFGVKGSTPYAQLKFEGGVHRVQRVPETESQGRIHTSTASVAVLPEAEEVDIDIDPNDLKVDTYRASGHGGQSVNTTDSAVRITHLPTGVVVANQDEKSQIKNRDKAMKVLRSRLLQQKRDEEAAKTAEHKRSLIGTADRSEKIRTYNYPQDRITDHRIKYSRSNIQGAMDGQIDDLIERLQVYERELNAQNDDQAVA